MSTDTFWRRLTNGVHHGTQRADWMTFAGADWLERIMGQPVTDRFHAKQGRSTGRLILNADGRKLAVYLKRHYRLHWWRGLLATLWPRHAWSPARQEWEHLEWARGQGLPVPEAVAVGEYIGPWGRLRSCLAIEELSGMLPFHEAIPNAMQRFSPTDFALWKRGLVVEVARLARELHSRRWFHKDLYLCHFYVPSDASGEWRGNVHLIDLHRLTHHPWTWRIWQVKDLAQLAYSSEIPGVTPRDRVWFWRCYLGDGRTSRAARWLRRLVLLKWGRYRAHNRKKRHRLEENGT
jgi:hypothetical protein